MAYTAFKFAKPAGSDTGPTVVSDVLSNLLALADYAETLLGKGWVFSIVNGSGSARRPQYVYLKSASNERWLRATITWGTTSGEKYNMTSVAWDMSTNSGSTYDAIATWATTYDSSGNPTASTGAGGMSMMLFAMLGHFWRHVDDYDTHAASTSAHSMGSMAQQAATAVAITGGSIATQLQRVTMPAGATLGTKSAAFNIDLSLGHYFTLTVAAGAVATFTNKPASGTVHPFTLEITNGGLVADQTLFPGCKASAGALTLQTSGTDLVHGLIRDGSTIIFTGVTPAIATLA